MNSFYPPSDLATKQPLPILPQCGLCGLVGSCQSPKMPVAGKGRKGILVVGEAPGKEEDLAGKPFVGRSGQLLQTTLGKFGVDLFKDCWVTNSLICRPPGNKIQNDKQIDYCRPNLIRVVKELEPQIILLLGGSAVKSLIGWLWKEDPGGAIRWAGWKIPSQRLNAWVCPAYHPSYILRSEEEGISKKQNEVRLLVFEQHLKDACSLEGRPWKVVPDYSKKVEKVLDLDRVKSILDSLIVNGIPVAFDYETNMLKPDCEEAQILCCAVSNGEKSWAFPWHGKAIQAMKKFLASSCPKIAHNLRFEERWSFRLLGVRVNNWIHDSMLAAHLLDNRKEVTGLKFQAFALLGAESYDDSLKPYMVSDNSNTPNRLKEKVSLGKLLTYCGLDALLTWEIAKIQRHWLGV